MIKTVLVYVIFLFDEGELVHNMACFTKNRSCVQWFPSRTLISIFLNSHSLLMNCNCDFTFPTPMNAP